MIDQLTRRQYEELRDGVRGGSEAYDPGIDHQEAEPDLDVLRILKDRQGAFVDLVTMFRDERPGVTSEAASAWAGVE